MADALVRGVRDDPDGLGHGRAGHPVIGRSDALEASMIDDRRPSSGSSAGRLVGRGLVVTRIV